jgi:hypothetical protein
MYGFGYTADLGKRVFYFSCKNKSSKVYTCFVEIVVLVTHSTAKLSLQFLDFSVILYGFYKLQHFGSRSETDSSRTGPWFSQSGP